MCYVAIGMAVLAAYSAYSSSQASKTQAEYQAGVAANNQKVAEWQAQDAIERGNTAAAQVRAKYLALQGRQRAVLAAKGLDISEGSPNATLTDTSYFGSLDESTTRANAAREAWGYKVRAANFGGDASAYSASAASQNPWLSAAMAGGSTYLGAGGTVSDRWYQGNAQRWKGWGGSTSDPWYG